MTKKVLILDFDGTFYSGINIFSNVKGYVDRNRRKFLPYVSDTDYKTICKENTHWLEAVSGKDIVKEIYLIKNKYPQFKISTEAFWQCQEDETYDINLVGAHITNQKEIEAICKSYPTYLVSNSSPKHIYHYLKKFGIDLNCFKEIISNHFEEYDQTKQHYYKDIQTKEKVNSNQIYVFGDSESSDLQPGKNLGFNTTLVKDAHALCDAINESVNEFLEEK